MDDYNKRKYTCKLKNHTSFIFNSNTILGAFIERCFYLKKTSNINNLY